MELSTRITRVSARHRGEAAQADVAILRTCVVLAVLALSAGAYSVRSSTVANVDEAVKLTAATLPR